jgi:ubiquinone/menaquinone biosynthesis C-methylase UbiE
MKKYPELYTTLAKVIARNISPSHPVIVDVGVGPGLLSGAILKQVSDARVIGIDPSIEMIQQAHRELSSKRFHTVLGKAEGLPFRDKVVDVVMSRFSLEYWENPLHCFSEIFRVLKPGGHVIIEALNKEFPKWRLLLIKYHMLVKSARMDVVRYHLDAFQSAYSVEQVSGFLVESGFDDIIVESKKNDWKYVVVGMKLG